MRIKCLAFKGTTAGLGFEPGTSGMEVCGLIHSATTASL